MTQLEDYERLTRLWHVKDSCETLLRITAGKTALEYEADETLRLAAERLFIIIGEALCRLRTVDPSTAASHACAIP